MAISGIATIPALKEVYVQLKTRMDKAVQDFSANLAAARTGRATVHMLDTVRVPYYGSEMPLNQVAQVHAPGKLQMLYTYSRTVQHLGRYRKRPFVLRGWDSIRKMMAK